MKSLHLVAFGLIAFVKLSLGAILGTAQAARADAIGLDFSLPETTTTPQQPAAKADQVKPVQVRPDEPQPLELPKVAPPVGAASLSGEAQELPPPPPQPIATFTPQPEPEPEPEPESVVASHPAIELNFEPPAVLRNLLAVRQQQRESATETVFEATGSDRYAATSKLFAGGPNSLVARAVGSAEGTRTSDGHRTRAYYGHVDPGNGVWNLGSFSYQHGANSPEEADVKQLRRLEVQSKILREKAVSRGLELTLEEELNGIDLANQAPMAALGRGGYVDWLAQAHQMGLSGSEAVVWARTRSFIDPDTSRWNAPGLGNNVHSIATDQERRQQAIARALETHQRQQSIQLPEPPQVKAGDRPPEESIVDQLFSQDATEQSEIEEVNQPPALDKTVSQSSVPQLDEQAATESADPQPDEQVATESAAESELVLIEPSVAQPTAAEELAGQVIFLDLDLPQQ